MKTEMNFEILIHSFWGVKNVDKMVFVWPCQKIEEENHLSVKYLILEIIHKDKRFKLQATLLQQSQNTPYLHWRSNTFS